jgi:hypothetical protein
MMNKLQEEQLIRETREAERNRQALMDDADFKTVIDTPAGRRFIRRALGKCGVHRTSFNADPMIMAFSEGERSIGLWLQSLFVDCPDQYIQLLKEESHVRNNH